MCLAAGAGFYGVARLCFSLLRGGCEATLVFYNWKFRSSFPRLLRCVLRFGGFSCVCWGYSDWNCRVRGACWGLDPVGLWRGWCSVGIKKKRKNYLGGRRGHTAGNAAGFAVVNGRRAHTVFGVTRWLIVFSLPCMHIFVYFYYW